MLAENRLAIVLDRTGFAVHQVRRANDFAAEGSANGLMAETDAQQRHASGEMANQVDADAGLLRSAWAGRDEDAIGMQSLDFGDRGLIVASGRRPRAPSSPIYCTRL